MKNKKKADIILLLLLIAFLLINILKISIGSGYAIRMITFVVEAALVGSIADWFAITALYKKPLGFFSWHTAIIPKNREKVIDAVSKMVENELMSKKMLQQKIDGIDFSKYIIEYIEKDMKKDRYLSHLAVKLVNIVDTTKLAKQIEELLKREAHKVRIEKFISKVFDYILSSKEADKAVDITLDYVLQIIQKTTVTDSIINFLNEIIDENVETKGFFGRLAFGIAERTNSVNTEEAAEAIQKELMELIRRLKNKDDTMRIYIEEKVREGVYEEKKLIKISEYVQKFKDDAVVAISIETSIESILRSFVVGLKTEFEGDGACAQVQSNEYNADRAVLWIKQQVLISWNRFKDNNEVKNNLNRYLRVFILKIIRSQHKVIGNIVKNTLSSFTDEALNKFIEDKAGEELHWIRINGCIVGAIFGALVFLFTNEIYEPIIKLLYH